MAEEPSARWLEDVLERAVREGMCVRVACTTCGAAPFRTALRRAATESAGSSGMPTVPRGTTSPLVEALAALPPPPRRFEEALRLILVDLWSGLGEQNFRTRVETRLEGTPVGGLLLRMREHSAEVERQRLAGEAWDTPAAVAARRAERKRLREAAHAERLRAKPARDAAWFARKAQASPE